MFLTFFSIATLQAVNLVNGMIVDGLGHVSLDSGSQPQQQQQQLVQNAANIHQGSIPATGRKDPQRVQNGAAQQQQQQGLNMAQGSNIIAGASAAAAAAASAGRASTPTTPMSAANSLQFNQLIGGAVSPSVLAQQPAQVAPAAAAHQPQAALQLQQGNAAAAQNLLFGDYATNLNNVLGGTAFRQQ